MASTPGIRIVAASDAPWADVRTVFGTRGDPAGCWCQFFKVDPATWKAQDRAFFERELCDQTARADHGGAGPGVLAYVDDEPAGWCAVEPRGVYPRIERSRVLTDAPEARDDAAGVWAVTCFVVRVGFRRRGVAAALLAEAEAHARRHGARVVEAYPVDPGDKKVSADELYHGPLRLFEAAGWDVVARSGERRAVVRRVL